MRSDVTVAGLTLMVFAFPALMAWTGMLIGIDGQKIKKWRWIVEDVFVANFGRPGAALFFLCLGAATVPLAIYLSRSLARRAGTGR